MNDISGTLKEVYRAKAAIVVPGSGTSAWKPWRGSSRPAGNAW